MSSLKRRAEELTDETPLKFIKFDDEPVQVPGFKLCFDVNEVIPKKKIGCGVTYDETVVFLITRLRYISGFLYLFLTGHNNVQFYFRTPCTIYSYKQCYHMHTPCPKRCRPYKSMVVTGLKVRECHRLNVFKIDRAVCKPDESFLLDHFCTDENRVQMQLHVYEGDYVTFADGVTVSGDGCAVGALSSIVKVSLNRLTSPIDTIVGCYDLETYTNLQSFSNPKVDPIITISYVLHTHTEIKKFCLINTQNKTFSLEDAHDVNVDTVDGDVIVLPFRNERDMIVSFFALLCGTNPDDVLDYNGDKFDLPFLMERASQLNIDDKFMCRYDLPPVQMNKVQVNTKFKYKFDNYFMGYFNHLDVYQFIKSSIDAGKLENLKLNTVATYYLKLGKVELSVREMMALYEKNQFGRIIKYNVRDSILPIQMYRKCRIANKVYADAALLYMSRDDYNLTVWSKINLALFNRALTNVTDDGRPDEYFLNKYDLSKIMHVKKNDQAEDESDEDGDADVVEKDKSVLIDFTNLNRGRVPVHQIPEDSAPLCELKTRIKYTGGKVLSPVPGYYKMIFTLDFSQLYTSIMIHYNTCLSNLFYGADNKLYLQQNTNAITTKFLKEMANKRATYKKEMKKFSADSFEYQMYDSWQNAAKLVCNSQYGYFGLCCKPLANFITAQGRTKLSEAQVFLQGLSEDKTIKEKWGLSVFHLNVIYGDTDSNFVSAYMLPEEYEKIGGVRGFEKLILEDILAPLNSLWSGAFKMELENIMDGTLIKGKKMYMCLKANGALYKRGLNVKKDIPLFLREAFDDTYRLILTKHSLECVLNTLVTTLVQRRNEFCVSRCEDYSFSQTLNETKNGRDGKPPSVAYGLYVILRNNANTKYVPSSGDRIPYLLIDKPDGKVRNCSKPTQLITEHDNLNWSKHLNVIGTFLNGLMAMLRNDTLFVHAFEEVCDRFQREQCYNVVYPNLKEMSDSRKREILGRELNVNKKDIIVDAVDHKFIHTHEFKLLKRKPKYSSSDEASERGLCPVCDGCGVAAVDRKMVFNLR
ncbi:dnapol [Clostera anastomosis granulovirus A]|uniref:DNA-directed DNA polymerase n=1 Tax=Clostera anastomosis granulovirus A TaxID=1986289 RepID=U5KBB1_9BBAC|nr:dnapol [Clostera anastomosis granulovirus Henan]AGQ20355.1 dnapol [Clostera anastomosis granulovirus Henan]